MVGCPRTIRASFKASMAADDPVAPAAPIPTRVCVLTMLPRPWLLLSTFILSIAPALGHSCSNNRIPYGLEVFRNGQPSLLCSRPNCFEKTYADCDERAMRKSCPSNTSWVGGFDKGYGLHEPLYVQCCEFEDLPRLSEVLFTSVIIRPGEYFEGEEVTNGQSEKIVSFDLISDITMIREGPPDNQTLAYKIDIRRFHCSKMVKPKIVKNWRWP
uniref:WxxW domain-containing protein n=1 Tax=Panagrellus redivivus TaxID=6233 RepID=A0A7E4UYG5_PANRE